MDNFPSNNNQNNNSAPSVPPRNVPPPPPPPITIRTMDSDVKSLEQTGGAGSVPQSFNINQPPEIKAAPEIPKDIKISMPGYEGPEEKLFTPETIAETNIGDQAQKNGSSRIILFTVIFVVVIGGLGAAGYFLYPVFFPNQPAATPPPAVVTPPPATPPAVSIKHSSYITSDGATLPVLSLAGVTPPTMASGTKSMIKEVILEDANNNQITFPKYFSSIITEFSEGDLGALFADDFTTFIYYTEQSAWSGYVAKLKAGVPAAVAQTTMSKIESFPSIANLFLLNPGEKSGAGFKNGQLNGLPSRYVTFSTKNAAINYAFIGNYLLISTSYAGALEAQKRLIVSTTP